MQNSVENSGNNQEFVKKDRPTALKDIDAEAIRLMGMAWRKEISLSKALQQLGYPANQAKKGWTLVNGNRALRGALAVAKAEEIKQLQPDNAPQLEAEQDAAIINARLRSNIQEGTDKAVNSCKLLGSRKDLNMWTADSVAGMVVISVPQIPSSSNIPTLDATEVRLLNQ